MADKITEFRDSVEAAGMSNAEYQSKFLELLDAQPDPTVETTEVPVEETTTPVVDNRPVSGRGEGRAAFQTPKGPDSVFSPDFQPSEVEEEGAKALAGGVLKTLDSITSFPERMVDLASGEIDRQGDDYEPDWSFSKQFNVEPIIYNSEWGPFAESIAHYGSLGITIAGAIAASPFALPTIGGGKTIASKALTGFAQGSIIGIGQDAVSINSHEQNASRMLIDRWPAMEKVVGSLATEDSDSATSIWFKNIAEGLWAEALLGGTWELLGQGLSKIKRAKLKGKVKDSALQKLEDRYNQVKDKANAEFSEKDEFLRTISDLEQRQLGGEVIDMDNLPPSPYMGVRGASDKTKVNPWQGTAISRSTPFDNLNNLNKMDKEDSLGSVDAIFTILEAEDLATNGINKGLFKRIQNKLINDKRFKDLVSNGKKAGKSTYTIFKQSFDRYAELAGLNFKNPKADWDAFLKRTGLTVNDIINHELIVNSTSKITRDFAIVAKEVHKMGGNIFAADGPMKNLADRLVAGFDLIGYNRIAARSNIKNADKFIEGIHKENLEGVDLLMNFLDREAPEELIEQVLTFLGTSHRSGKISDFNNWMRQKMTGGQMLPGANKQGALKDELDQIHINSFFGPKTLQRAIWGTGFNAYLNQFNDVLGAALRYPITRDSKQFKAQFASLMSMIDFIPDAFKIFKGNLGEAFRPNAIIDNRFTAYGRRHLDDVAYEQWLEFEGSESDQIVYHMWKIGHNLNGETKLGRAASAISRGMDAGDKTFEELVRHKRVKEIAMRDALLAQEKGDISEITPALLDAAGQLYEQKYYNEFGDIDLSREAFTKAEFNEITYRTELEGASKAFSAMIEQMPLIKPYFRFIRSGINGLRVKTGKLPIVAGLLKKQRDIFFAKPGDLNNVRKYGIESAWDLERMKGRQIAQQAVGFGLTYVAVQKFLGGGLWGNGANVQGMRNVFRDTGGEPNTIEIGGKRVSLDLFEPFDLLFKGVADVGANMHIMGEEWAEDKLQAFAIATAFSEAATDESFLSAVGDLVDVIRGKPGSVSRLTSNIAHFVPFGGWRRFAGQSLTDSYREINSSIWNDKGIMESGPIQSIRKDNLITEFLSPLTGNTPLPLKYNMLNGEKFKDTNVLGRIFRAGSFVAIEPGASAGQKLLWRSNYDLRTSTWNSGKPDNVSLKDNSYLRSEFGREIGLTKIHGENPEQWLNRLAKEPRIIASIKEMNEDRSNGNYDIDPMKSYYHNRAIRQGFKLRREMAWLKVRQLPEAQALIQTKLEKQTKQNAKLYKTTNQELPLHPAR